MTAYPIFSPAAAICPMTAYPDGMAMGRKSPVSGNFYIASAAPAPFGCYPDVTGGRRIAAYHHRGGRRYTNIKMLGFSTGGAQNKSGAKEGDKD